VEGNDLGALHDIVPEYSGRDEGTRVAGKYPYVSLLHLSCTNLWSRSALG
jgi:hypothetical protein